MSGPYISTVVSPPCRHGVCDRRALGPSAAGFAAGNKVIELTWLFEPRQRSAGAGFRAAARSRFAQGAALPVTYLTAYQLVVAMGRLRAGETILVHSAAGGVGLSATNLAQVVGAHVIGVASPMVA